MQKPLHTSLHNLKKCTYMQRYINVLSPYMFRCLTCMIINSVPDKDQQDKGIEFIASNTSDKVKRCFFFFSANLNIFKTKKKTSSNFPYLKPSPSTVTENLFSQVTVVYKHRIPPQVPQNLLNYPSLQ